MSRGFTGTRITSGSSKRSSKEIFLQKMRGEDPDKMSPDQRYKKLMDDKMDELRAEVKKSTGFGVSLPGTEKSSDSRTLSKSAQQVVEKMIQKKAKKHAKKNQYHDITITPRIFGGMQGGRIDSKGHIYGPDGQYVAYVCKKSGKVKNRWGTTICKYSDSSYCEFSIGRFIEDTYNKNRPKNIMGGFNGHGEAGGGVHGSGGSVWGPSDDNNGGVWGSGW